MNKRLYFFAVVFVVLIVGVFFLMRGSGVQSVTSTQTPEIKMPTPSTALDPSKNYSAILHTTAGDITISFDTKNTPITSNNFISLAKKGFYNNTIFHRVIPGFMIQGGDPEGTGMGGPGYQFPDEYLQGTYTRGVVAMANAGPNTNGSQFFIMHKDYDLPNAYVIFAKVSSGIETVDKIATAATKPGGEGSAPVDPVKIVSVDIIEK